MSGLGTIKSSGTVCNIGKQFKEAKGLSDGDFHEIQAQRYEQGHTNFVVKLDAPVESVTRGVFFNAVEVPLGLVEQAIQHDGKAVSCEFSFDDRTKTLVAKSLTPV